MNRLEAIVVIILSAFCYGLSLQAGYKGLISPWLMFALGMFSTGVGVHFAFKFTRVDEPVRRYR